MRVSIAELAARFDPPAAPPAGAAGRTPAGSLAPGHAAPVTTGAAHAPHDGPSATDRSELPLPQGDAEAEVALAEVMALLPRVNLNWRSYITTRLEVDAGSVDRLRKVRDWALAHVELAPAAGLGGDDTPAGGADN
jgi:hypothetical protein